MKNWSRADIPWLIFIGLAVTIVIYRLSSGGGERYGIQAVSFLILGILDFIGQHINTGGWGKSSVGHRLNVELMGEEKTRRLYKILDACLLGSSILLVLL